MNAVVYRGGHFEHESWANAPCIPVMTPAPWRLAQRAKTTVRLNSHICEVLRNEESRLFSKIAIRRRVDPDLWPIEGDRSLLYELVLALALNAVEAIEDEGRVTFETRNLRLAEGCITRATGLAPGPYVMLVVEDTGRGMNAETLARVFEPAYAAERGPDRPVLAGVRQIAELHGGSVSVASAPLSGTVVRVYLPAAPPEDSLSEAPPAR